jgi:hypothetical protein
VFAEYFNCNIVIYEKARNEATTFPSEMSRFTFDQLNLSSNFVKPMTIIKARGNFRPVEHPRAQMLGILHENYSSTAAQHYSALVAHEYSSHVPRRLIEFPLMSPVFPIYLYDAVPDHVKQLFWSPHLNDQVQFGSGVVYEFAEGDEAAAEIEGISVGTTIEYEYKESAENPKNVTYDLKLWWLVWIPSGTSPNGKSTPPQITRYSLERGAFTKLDIQLKNVQHSNDKQQEFRDEFIGLFRQHLLQHYGDDSEQLRSEIERVLFSGHKYADELVVPPEEAESIACSVGEHALPPHLHRNLAFISTDDEVEEYQKSDLFYQEQANRQPDEPNTPHTEQSSQSEADLTDGAQQEGEKLKVKKRKKKVRIASPVSTSALGERKAKLKAKKRISNENETAMEDPAHGQVMNKIYSIIENVFVFVFH